MVILYVYLLMLAVGPGRLQISDDMSQHLLKIDILIFCVILWPKLKPP